MTSPSTNTFAYRTPGEPGECRIARSLGEGAVSAAMIAPLGTETENPRDGEPPAVGFLSNSNDVVRKPTTVAEPSPPRASSSDDSSSDGSSARTLETVTRSPTTAEGKNANAFGFFIRFAERDSHAAGHLGAGRVEGHARGFGGEGDVESIQRGAEDVERERGVQLAAAEGGDPGLAGQGVVPPGAEPRGELERREEVRDARREPVRFVLRLLRDPEEGRREPRRGGGEGGLRHPDDAPGRPGELGASGRVCGGAPGRVAARAHDPAELRDVRRVRADAAAGARAPRAEVIRESGVGVAPGRRVAALGLDGVRAARRRAGGATASASAGAEGRGGRRRRGAGRDRAHRGVRTRVRRTREKSSRRAFILLPSGWVVGYPHSFKSS